MRFRFIYTGVRVKSIPRSRRFYAALGFSRIGGGTMKHGGRYMHLRQKDSKHILELNWYPKGSRFYTEYAKGEELDHLAFVVKDVKKAYRELIRQGATSAVSPEESGGTEVYVKDPDGIWIELLQGK
jgi:catechol 2,3-dioxygenase-like lactoylglutathione lyase family enzyme